MQIKKNIISFLNYFLFKKRVIRFVLDKYFYNHSLLKEDIEKIEQEVIPFAKQKNNKVIIEFKTKERPEEPDRYSYQKDIIHFDIKHGDLVLDIGSGDIPFPLATHLADFYPDDTTHRYENLKTDSRQFINCNVEEMPFKDKEFDYVYCSHLLEHVDNPEKACEEIMRVGKRGYIETPTKTSDIMFNFTHLKNHHKWYVDIINNTLIFIEWYPPSRKDLGTYYFLEQYTSKWENQFQNFVYTNREMFVNMFLWKDKFNYIVIRNDRSVTKNY